MEKEKIEQIQIASNETILAIMKQQKESIKTIKVMFISLLIAICVIVMSCVGGAIYFFNTFDLEATTTETTTQTVEGEGAEISNVEGNQYKDNSTHNENKEGVK